MILLIDNYDSFSYNLFQLIGGITPDIRVIRNDELTVEEIFALSPSHIILSPGPGRPCDAGVCEDVIRADAQRERPVPLLGVCLGHQAICESFGAKITYAKQLMHGKKSLITAQGVLFGGIDGAFYVARYHSLAAEDEDFPEELRVSARTDDGEIMAVEHKALPIYGVQFHPESILTQHGRTMAENFLSMR